MLDRHFGAPWFRTALPLPADPALQFAATAGYLVTLVVLLALLVVLSTSAVMLISDEITYRRGRRAQRFMDAEIARGALESFVQRQPFFFRDERLDGVFADVVEGRRAVRRLDGHRPSSRTR